MQRPQGPKGPAKGKWACCDSEFHSNWPKLSQGLCDPWWEDGKARNPWTLKVAFNGDQCVVTINDTDNKLVCFTASAGLKECLDAIELALDGEGLSWRKSKW